MNFSKIEKSKLEFSCGCEFPIINGRIHFVADMHSKDFNVNFNCLQTYQDLSDGLTEGVFQLTSQLGMSFSKKLKPQSIDHIASLGAALRPSCLDSKLEDGKSMTTHYVMRKNSEENVPSFNPVVDEVLKNDYGILLYQESSMQIAAKCAGFDLQEADSLRKAIGKKLPEEMAKSKKLFLEKAKTFGVLNDEQAETIFGQIEASQRYAFCKSHAYSYGILGYICAYIKTHFPIQFYKGWLKCENDRTEYRKLINEAKLFGISVHPPDIRHLKMEFYNIKSDIYFGLYNIKGIKKSDIDGLATLMTEKNIDPVKLGDEVSWIRFLAEVLEDLSSNTVSGLIYSGSCDCFKLDREVMWREYSMWRDLTDKEKGAYCKDAPSLEDSLRSIVDHAETDHYAKMLDYQGKLEKRVAHPRKKEPKALVEPKPYRRLKKIKDMLNLLVDPVYNIQDTIDSRMYHEEDLLGVALTVHPTSGNESCVATHTCLEIAEGCHSYAVLKVRLDRVKIVKCKTGPNAGEKMAFLEVSDESFKYDNVVIFTKGYKEFQYLLTQDNIVFLSGRLDRESYVVDKVYSIS